ncbi:uncharacterized protein [Mytilus edulis]|uniref:uncharacterized protein n=1 Tax=Mytilus edulis TaxID=6550 RepID=UPI0039EEE0A1
MVVIRKRKAFLSAKFHSGKSSKKVVFSKHFRGVKADEGEVSDLQHHAKSFGETSTSLSSVLSVAMPGSSAIEEMMNEIQPDAKTGKRTYLSLKEQRLHDWSTIRDDMYEAFISTEAPSTVSCHECKKEAQLFKCIDCTPWEMVCEDCLYRRHQYPHLHMFEAWRNEAFVGAVLKTPSWILSSHSDCDSNYFKSIVIIDVKGRQHKRNIQFCKCEPEAVTLVKYRLWPSTTKFPKLAFDMELLKWLYGLLIECHVSCKGFCEALKFRSSKYQRNYVNFQVLDIYKSLMTETFAEFRNFFQRTEFPDKLDNGTECPACFSTLPKIYSFDADFQLVRKASSGKQWAEPKHSNKFFLDQASVDAFMGNYYEDRGKPDVECNDFQAGNHLRSKNKNKKLAETAVFGSTCRHEFPKYFFSLKHGERLGYAVYLLRKLLEEENSDDKDPLYIMYDIACSLESHLKKQNDQSILDKVQFAIPIFHCYGHKMACQVLYNPRKKNGIGLTDGESLERLWSYLGKFSKITKEMTPENRIDLLTDGLIHYGQKIREKLGHSLVAKIEKAIRLEKSSIEELEELLKPFTSITEEVVLSWIEDEKVMVTSSQNEPTLTLTTQEQYSLELEKMDDLRKRVPPAKLEEDQTYKKLTSTIQKLQRKLKEKWDITADHDVYETNLAAAKEKSRNVVLVKLGGFVSERHFLLELVKKYARGQSIAIRLCRQLKKTGNKIHHTIKEYNNIGGPTTTLPLNILFNDIKDRNGDIWKTIDLQDSGEIPAEIKQRAVNAKSLIERSKEEKSLLRLEMKSTLDWHFMQHSILLDAFNHTRDGKRACIVKEGLYIETKLSHLENCFRLYLDSEIKTPNVFFEMIEMGENSNGQEFESLLRDRNNMDNFNFCEDDDVEDDDNDDDVEDDDNDDDVEDDDNDDDVEDDDNDDDVEDDDNDDEDENYDDY